MLRASTVSSSVLVRNGRPTTPTKSPMSISLEDREGLLADDVALDVDLDAAAAVLQVKERRLAEVAHARRCARRGSPCRAALELLAAQRRRSAACTPAAVSVGTKVVGKGIDAARTQLLELAPARRDQIGAVSFHGALCHQAPVA